MKAIAPQYVVPFRKGNKNDYNDALAIAEASQRNSMRFVPIKTVEQQGIQVLHRIRDVAEECIPILSSLLRTQESRVFG
ncbi:transposase [Parashewanella spongiae]|uniref:Transposase n=1 Tax=Parashewanella spongiae TaxID=342950 RepID=A0A3A6T9K4_9GAMM|nr:transposase [Parashewanella spongiae]